MSKRQKNPTRLKEVKTCCVCIYESVKPCTSVIEIINNKELDEITILKILQTLNLLHYEVKI